MSGFWSSLFGGANDTLKGAIPKYGQISGFETGLGEKNITEGSNFFSDILKGGSSAAKVLAPEIKNIQGQVQQSKNTTAQFGNRSGGNNAAMQTASDKGRASVNDMISSLLGTAGNTLLNSGQNLLNAGTDTLGKQVDASQIQMQNWQNSILGRGVTGVSDTLFNAATGGLGKIPGLSAVV